MVLTSCSHRGVINTVRQAMEASGIDKVHAVIGGFHVVPPLGDDYINKTIEEFRDIDPDYLITGALHRRPVLRSRARGARRQGDPLGGRHAVCVRQIARKKQ